MVVVDLDTHVAEFWLGTTDPLTLIATWDWTQGATKPIRLDCNDFFGAAATDEMYVDNYSLVLKCRQLFLSNFLHFLQM